MDVKRITTQDPLYHQVWQLREAVLRRPLGLSLRDEDLSGEEDQIILAAVENGQVAGCVLLQPFNDGVVKLRQMAVAEGRQQGGIGRALVMAAEREARNASFLQIELHARVTVEGFYRKLGYVPDGDVFEEVGIPHLKMVKSFH